MGGKCWRWGQHIPPAFSPHISLAVPRLWPRRCCPALPSPVSFPCGHCKPFPETSRVWVWVQAPFSLLSPLQCRCQCSSEAKADIWDWRGKKGQTQPLHPAVDVSFLLSPAPALLTSHFLGTFPWWQLAWRGWNFLLLLGPGPKGLADIFNLLFYFIIITLFAFIWLSSQAVAGRATGICRELNWTGCAWVFLHEPQPAQTSLSLT